MPSFSSLSRALAAISFLIACSTAQQCYFPNGAESNHTPCTSNGSPTACCAASAFCLANGLCFGDGIVTRGSCTDKAWDGNNCPQYCKQGRLKAQDLRGHLLTITLERPGGSIALTPCTSDGTKNTFVCDLNTTACRDQTQTFSLGGDSDLVLRPVQVSAVLAAANATASATTSTSTRASATASANATAITSSSDAADAVRPGAQYTSSDMAGLGFGLAIPLFIVACFAFRLWRRERARTPKLMYPLPDEDTFDLKPPPSNYFQPHPAVRSISSRDGYPAGKDSYDLGSFRPISPTQGRETPPHMQTFAERYHAMNKGFGNLHEQSSFELDGQPVGSKFRFTTSGKEGEKEKKEPLTATTIDLGNRTVTTRDRDRERKL